MRASLGLGGLMWFIVLGCGGERSVPVISNPYEPQSTRQPERAAVPAPGRQPNAAAPPHATPAGAVRPQPEIVAAPERAGASTPSAPPPSVANVPGAGKTAVQLTSSEYGRMARRAADMLNELAELHIAVDESGDAAPYQDRWGELTAELTRLHRDVLASGHPPPDVVRHLQESWLPALKDAVTKAQRATEAHTGVDSGLDRSRAEVESIYAHLMTVRKSSTSR